MSRTCDGGHLLWSFISCRRSFISAIKWDLSYKPNKKRQNWLSKRSFLDYPRLFWWIKRWLNGQRIVNEYCTSGHVCGFNKILVNKKTDKNWVHFNFQRNLGTLLIICNRQIAHKLLTIMTHYCHLIETRMKKIRIDFGNCKRACVCVRASKVNKHHSATKINARV